MNTPSRSLRYIAIAASLTSALFAQNNECSGALPIATGTNGPYSNVGATTSTPAWPIVGAGNDVWFSFNAIGTGNVTIDTCGSSFDTTLQVFDGLCGNLVSLGSNDDSCGTGSSITVPVNLGPHRVRVGGYNGATGTFILHVSGPVQSLVQATNTTLGAGCQTRSTSFYESFLPSTFDLGNSAITMIPSGGGYAVQQGTATFLPPSPSAAVLALGDESETTVPLSAPMPHPGGATSSLTVCSNGYVSVTPGNGVISGAAPQTVLNAPITGWWICDDFDPSILAGGRVKFEQVGTKACVTWDGVWRFGGTSQAHGSTFQFQFDTSNGFVHMVFQNINAFGTMVGYSPGGPSADAGAVDLSAALPAGFTLPAVDIFPLTLTASTRPVVGGTWSLNVTNIPATGTLGVDVLGFTDPGIGDLTALGLPGCGLRASLDLLTTWTPFASSHGYAIGIPASPSLVNFHLFTTSAVFVPGVNPFGAITANGIDGKLGDI